MIGALMLASLLAAILWRRRQRRKARQLHGRRPEPRNVWWVG